MRSLIFLGGLAALFITSTAASAQMPGSPMAPVIVTSGDAVVKRAPDRAWLTIATETRDSKADAARRKSAEVMTDVQNAVRRAGIAADAIRTIGFSLTPEMNYNNGRGEIRGYVVSNRIEVRVDDLTMLGPVLDAAQTRSGTGLSVIGPRFDLKNTAEVQNEALRLAVESARARAQAIAQGAGRSLGPIVRIEEAGIPMPPMPQREMMAFKAADAGPDTPVTPGEIEVRASVRLTVEIR